MNLSMRDWIWVMGIVAGIATTYGMMSSRVTALESKIKDFTNIVNEYFTIIDAFHWYQDSTIDTGEFSICQSSILLRCKKKK